MRMESEENFNNDSSLNGSRGADKNELHGVACQKQSENLEKESSTVASPKVDSSTEKTGSLGFELCEVNKSECHMAQTGTADLIDEEQIKTKTELETFSNIDKEDSPQILHANMNSDKITNRPVLPVGVNCSGDKLVGDEKDNYQEITSSEISSLDEWEHLHKSCLMEIPPVDPGALHEIEKQAKLVARNLDHMLGTLASHLNAVTKIDTQALAAYNSSIDHANSTVDKSIKGMYTLISKCEELNSNMEPVARMAAQIKEIKKALDIFESMCK